MKITIPEETKIPLSSAFLVALILDCESMTNQERNYWMQVLPEMNEAQVAELRDILETEKRKLEEIAENL